MDELQKEFIIEANDLVKELDTALVELSHDPSSSQQLNKIFRVFHTLKGASGFLNLERLETLTHEVEDVLAALQSEEVKVTPALISCLFECVDVMKYILKTLEITGKQPSEIDITLSKSLRNFLTNPEFLRNSPSSKKEMQEPSEDLHVSSGIHSIRVNLSLLESLTTAVSELVLIRNQLMNIGAESSESKIEAPLKRLNQITSYLQETSLKAHMQPIGSAWSKLPRLVHDLSQSLKKDILLKTEGSEVELDRQIIEVLQDPLLHIIRNAADHGIETPKERHALGKPKQGTIFLRAEHKDGAFRLIIKDDGRGIDTNKIREQLLKNKLVSPDELESMYEKQLYQTIFTSGFSTANKITTLSGRGVGMDLVKNKVESIGGNISIETEPGKGTTFILFLPVTLSIIQGILVRVGQQRYIIPRSSIQRIITLHPKDKLSFKGTLPSLETDEGKLGLLFLYSFLLEKAPANTRKCSQYIIQTQNLPTPLGLVVEDIEEVQDVVIKPLSDPLCALSIYGGCTILGDGTVAMIFDPMGLYNKTVGNFSQIGGVHG